MEYIARYKDMRKVVPHEKRKEINDKIIYMIDNDLVSQYSFTPEIIFNFYTGDGGTFDVKFKDYNSFYEYSQEKKSLENGQFFTGQNESRKLIDILQINNDELVGELSCGSGALLNYLPNMNNVYCNELDIKAYKVCKYLFPEATITHGDMRNYNLTHKLDVIIGNPPFNLRLKYEGVDQYSQMIYIKKANELMNTSALIGLIVPYSFLNDEFSSKSDIEYINEHFNFIGQFELNKGAFDHVGVDSNFRIKMMFFVKKSKYLEEKSYINEFTTEKKIKEDISKIRQIKEKNRASIKLENMKNYTDEDQVFEKKVTKILFDIKRSKHVKHLYNECFNYYQLYYNQKQPSTLSNEEWQKIKITKEKVIKKLKDTLSSQHKKRTVKSENLEKTMRKKIKRKNQQDIPFEEMKIDENINKWLRESQVYNYDSEEEIYLNNEQKEMVNKMLQKQYGYIQSSQGTGKTLMGIHYALYREKNNNTKNTLCIAPSVAIYQTWEEVLQSYKITYRTIKTLQDIKNIKKNEFILITFNMLCKYKKRLKKYLQKKINNNYTLLLDEADSIARIESNRTESTLNIGKKAKYKLLMSGTMCRNNIVESFTQFKLLYGESLNFICKCKEKFVNDKKNNELKTEYTIDEYNKPFPAYKKGYKLFKSCFNPGDITVFGVNKNTQDIYNAEILKELINKTIITKTFEEVVGKKIYSINQEVVEFNDSEKELYNKIVNEFFSMKYLFSSTGNPRKDKFLEIIQQINLMLDATSQAPKFKEYNRKEMPNKYKKVLELLEQWKDERVIIGCRTLEEVKQYRNIIEKKFNNRKLHVITGSVSMNNRKNIIETMRSEKNSILLCTQQSLSSSVNIEYIDKCIITRLSWNYSTLSQFFFRIVRYNSTREKDIRIITYKNSLESNLLKLLMCKEELTNFMKNQEDMDIAEEFGVDFNLVDMLLNKERDNMGNVRIVSNWGNQKIS